MVLYAVKQEYDDLLRLVEDVAEGNDGVIPDELSDQLDAIEGEWRDKVTNCARAYKNMVAEAEAIRNEERTLATRRHSLENRAEWLKNYIGMNVTTGEAFSAPSVDIKWRKSEVVEILNADEIPNDYCKIVREPSKSAIKTALKAGGAVAGATLVEKNNIQIK